MTILESSLLNKQQLQLFPNCHGLRQNEFHYKDLEPVTSWFEETTQVKMKGIRTSRMTQKKNK